MGKDSFKEFEIPIKGLHVGEHEFTYTLKNDFFGRFEGGIIDRGEIEMLVVLDKHEDMIILEFFFSGFINSGCDRCTAQIEVPIEANNKLWIKFGEEKEEDYDDVIWVSHGEGNINVAKYIYEAVTFGVPMMKVYDCENDPNPRCNMEVLNKLNHYKEDEGEGGESGIWSELDKFE